jgi:nucleoside phosphorylase
MRNRRSLLIVTALGEELSPLLQTFQAELVPPLSLDGPYRAYEARLTARHGGSLDLIFCSAYRKGAVAMNAILTWAMDRFEPRRVVLAGIAATVPASGVSLSDILIARHIVDSSESKLLPGDDIDRVRRMASPCDDELAIPLEAYAERVARDDVAIGIVISQPDVVKSAKARDRIALPVARFFDEMPIGIEMEGGALVKAVAARPALLRPSFILVKGAVDFANIRKDDSAREAAARKVAQFLRSFLEDGWLVDPPEAVADPALGWSALSRRPLDETSYGRDALRVELLRELESPRGAPIFWIEGLGGIGKTTLARQLADEAEAGARFVKSATYSFEQRAEKDGPSAAAPDGAEIVEAFISQLGLAGLSDLPSPTREQRFFEIARTKPFLLTIDNLETPSDAEFVRTLLQRVGADSESRWLVTSRAAAGQLWATARVVRLGELSRTHSIALMRDLLALQPAGRTKAFDPFLESLYDAVGGNPLALRLSVGLLSRFPPDIVVDILRRGADPSDEFYRYIYKTAWSSLSEDARKLLIALRLAPLDGIDWPRLEAISGLQLRALTAAVSQLCAFNLLNVTDAAGVTIYAIHRLTATFAEDVARSWQAEERDAIEKAMLRQGLFHTMDLLRAAIE